MKLSRFKKQTMSKNFKRDSPPVLNLELQANKCNQYGEKNRFLTICIGLRARMEAGFSRMNDLTVLQASQGLAIYIEKTVKDAKSRGVVVGHDHRHHSKEFAQLTAAAFIQRGFKVWFYKELVHTPLVVNRINT